MPSPNRETAGTPTLQFGIGVFEQPVTSSQASAVHSLLSSQLSDCPARQVPLPSQTSVPEQALPSLQEVPAFWKPLSAQFPAPSQRSWMVHSVPSSPQVVVSARWFGAQVPDPSQVSWPEHAVAPSPQLVSAAAKPLSAQEPEPVSYTHLTLPTICSV